MFEKPRRRFLQYSFLSTAIFAGTSCKLFGITTPLQTIKTAQKDLFGFAFELCPNNLSYFAFVLNHSHVSQKEKEFLQNGAKWLNQQSEEVFQKIYANLDANDRQKILQNISKTSWGKRWIAKVLTYTMESMLADPVYGVNCNESGWKWLHHEGGMPKPKKGFA